MKGVHEGDPFGYGAEWDAMMKESSIVKVRLWDDCSFDLIDSQGIVFESNISLARLLEFMQECPHLKFIPN